MAGSSGLPSSCLIPAGRRARSDKAVAVPQAAPASPRLPSILCGAMRGLGAQAARPCQRHPEPCRASQRRRAPWRDRQAVGPCGSEATAPQRRPACHRCCPGRATHDSAHCAPAFHAENPAAARSASPRFGMPSKRKRTSARGVPHGSGLAKREGGPSIRLLSCQAPRRDPDCGRSCAARPPSQTPQPGPSPT